MRQFFKNVFSSFVGTFIALTFVGFVAVVTVIGIAAGLGEVFKKGIETPQYTEGYNFLKVSIGGEIVDYAEHNPLSQVKGLSDFFPVQTGVYQIKEAIKKASLDDQIQGIYLHLNTFSGGFAQAEEIRSALLNFQSSGKKIIAYSQNTNEKGYHILQVADHLGLNPLGILEFNGLNVEVMYFTGLFEKIGVEMEIFKAGRYKSAVEPYFRKSMSEANREQVSSFINDIHNELLLKTATSRNLSVDAVKEISDQLKIRNAEDAMKAGFVDAIAYEKEFLISQKEVMGLDEIAFINYNSYNALDNNLDLSGEKVVVLSTEGTIMDGSSQTTQQIGDKTVIAQLEKLEKDSSVKAVVLQINSPGGSATSSDRMWHAIQRLKVHKPVIASMSTYAASGGYYLAMACDKIVAQPMTITGSIGVFGVFPNFEKLYEDQLGLTTDRVNTGAYSDLFSTSKKMTPEKKEVIQKHIEEFYKVFLTKVSQGRGMSYERIAELAEGRVWTGKQANEIGLIDELGGLGVAIHLADPADLFKVVPYAKYAAQDIDEYIEGFATDKITIESQLLKDEQLKLFNKLKLLKKSTGIQARAPYILEIR